jgi:hypothetical protein
MSRRKVIDWRRVTATDTEAYAQRISRGISRNRLLNASLPISSPGDLNHAWNTLSTILTAAKRRHVPSKHSGPRLHSSVSHPIGIALGNLQHFRSTLSSHANPSLDDLLSELRTLEHPDCLSVWDPPPSPCNLLDVQSMVLLSMKRHLTALRALRLAEATDGVRKWGENAMGGSLLPRDASFPPLWVAIAVNLSFIMLNCLMEQAIASGTEVTSDPKRLKSILSSNLRGMFSHTQDTHHASLSSEWEDIYAPLAHVSATMYDGLINPRPSPSLPHSSRHRPPKRFLVLSAFKLAIFQTPVRRQYMLP